MKDFNFNLKKIEKQSQKKQLQSVKELELCESIEGQLKTADTTSGDDIQEVSAKQNKLEKIGIDDYAKTRLWSKILKAIEQIDGIYLELRIIGNKNSTDTFVKINAKRKGTLVDTNLSFKKLIAMSICFVGVLIKIVF